MRVRCIKEFHSKMYPEKNFGRLGEVYQVYEVRYVKDGSEPVHYLLYGLEEWVNVERFERVQE